MYSPDTLDTGLAAVDLAHTGPDPAANASSATHHTLIVGADTYVLASLRWRLTWVAATDTAGLRCLELRSCLHGITVSSRNQAYAPPQAREEGGVN